MQNVAEAASTPRVRLGAPLVVLALLCLLYFILYLDRTNISTAAPLIRKELGLSNTQMGLVFSAFAIPLALFQLIGGPLADTFGPRLFARASQFGPKAKTIGSAVTG